VRAVGDAAAAFPGVGFGAGVRCWADGSRRGVYAGTLLVGEVLDVLHLDDGRGRQVVAGVRKYGHWDRRVAHVNLT
jgi:hypothetical protein